MAGFAIPQVAGWTVEDSNGRLELVLSNPISRARVVVERLIALALGALIIAAVSGAAAGLESHYQSIDLSSNLLAQASLVCVPSSLVFATTGAFLASTCPPATVALFG